MLTGAGLARFRKKLLAWFVESQRDLPWRRTRNPYHIWLSEVMLQQTRVAAVIPYYARFLDAFPGVRALAEAPEEEVLRHWAGLGYYARARNLRKAARQIVTEHGGEFPNDPERARALSGIGAYTAAAILSIAYGRKLAVLDGNVARVLARLAGVRGDLRGGGRWARLQQTADELLAPGEPGNWNQAMMELGATVCTPRSPHCLLCPLAEYCEAHKRGLVNVIPEKRRQRDAVEITLAALVVVDRQGRTLLLPHRRSATNKEGWRAVAALLSSMWHFPTVPVEQNAERELRACAARAIFFRRKFDGNLRALGTVKHAVTYRQITVVPFRLDVAELPRVRGAKALPLGDLSAVPVSNLTRKVANAALSSEVTPAIEGAKGSALGFHQLVD